MIDKNDALLELNAALGNAFPDDPANAVRAHAAVLPLIQALAAPADCVGCEGTPAEGNNPCAVCGRGDPPAASAEDYERELSAVMPEDFKDWHQNDKREWPAVAVAVIRNLREREAMAWEFAARIAGVELVEAVRELRRCQRDYLSQPKGERIEAKGRLVGLAADRVDAALALFDSAGDTRPAATAQVPINWKLVPVVATPEMDAAGKKALSDNGVDSVEDSDALVCFSAMLAAAPAAPAESGKGS